MKGGADGIIDEEQAAVDVSGLPPIDRLPDGGLRRPSRKKQSPTPDRRPSATVVTSSGRSSRLDQAADPQRDWFNAISEGIWCVSFSEPVSMSHGRTAQIRQIQRQGIFTECNMTMAHMLGRSHCNEVIGASLTSFAHFQGIAEQLVRAGYNLKQWEIRLEHGERVRHFAVNAVGTVQDDGLVRIWGSATEITERVELERRMVAALENQLRLIGYELHDGLGQVLTAVGLISQCLSYNPEMRTGKTGERIRRLVALTGEAQEMVSGIYRHLAPPPLVNGQPLDEALKELCDRTERVGDIHCTFWCDREACFPENDAKIHLYRIVQEAVNNAVKHAKAEAIEVAVTCTDHEGLVIEVTDDGVGFDVSSVSTNSLGITSLLYRARAIGAELQIDSSPGQGATVRCCLPCPVS